MLLYPDTSHFPFKKIWLALVTIIDPCIILGTNITKAYPQCFTNRTKHSVLPTVNNTETFLLVEKPEKKLLLVRLLIDPKRKIKQHHQQKDTKASTGLVTFLSSAIL